MRCPFHPVCEADLEPVEQHVRPGSDDTELVYPVHNVQGPESWFGGCPGSMLLILPGEQGLTEVAEEVLKQAGEHYRQMVTDRVARARKAQAGQPVSPPPAMPGNGPWQRHAWFGKVPPGSPGAEDNKRPPLGKLQQEGSPTVDSERDTLKNLLTLAIGQMEQTRDFLIRANNLLDEANALITAAGFQGQSAQSLIIAAVGSASSDLPDSASAARDNIMAAAGKLEDSDGPAALVSSTQTRISAINGNLSAAVDNAKAYRALP